MKSKFSHTFVLLIALTLGVLSSAFCQDQPPPVDFQRNDFAEMVTAQPNGVPVRSGVTKNLEAYVTTKPGKFACSAANTGTTAINILAGTASVSHVISQIICTNTTATASLITFKNNVTTVHTDLIGTTTLGTNRIVIPFPKPIKVDGNKPFTFTMTTNSTSTICCADYLDEVNTTPTPTSTPTPTNTATQTPTPTRTPTPTP